MGKYLINSLSICNLVFSLSLSCEIFYILKIRPLSDTWFANIFSFSVCHLFIFLRVSYEAHFFFNLKKSSLYFILDYLCFDVIFKKSLPNLNSKVFILLFPYKNFIVLPLKFMSSINFELILIWDTPEIQCSMLL